MKTILIQMYSIVTALGYYLFNNIITYIPFHCIRILFARFYLHKFGKKSSLLLGVKIRNGRNISIGNNVVINSNVLLDGRGGIIVISNNVDIAQETNIWTLEHDVHSNSHAAIGGDVIIEDHVWIASRATILPQVILGKGCVVACNSVVTKSVPVLSIVGGIPAKAIGNRRSNLDYELNYRPWFK